ncbi:hypothetical protein [Mesonia maritima]|uniref:Lipoprotein n=1 Tax=Mesonia maritima TaxID=1793873 RepID=A0ABU1K7P2_9FLAO|nr:hypothetical protein [Mesonia maritima]MDR6301634.1 hypothetical protein [Mesonia maritima]
MKTYLQLIFLSILLLTFGCKEKTSGQKKKESEKQIEQQKSFEQQKDAIEEKKKKVQPTHYEHKYVIARSGLNYRDSPDGKVLGKFPLNTSLRLVEYTKISDTINDAGKLIVDKWVGVQNWMLPDKKMDTVYVFNGFLSNSFVQSDIKLYYASSFYKEKDGKTRTAFLNLSQTYFEDAYNETGNKNRNSIFTESDLEKDTIRLNKSQRDKFLKYSDISESDKVFVYLISSDQIQTYNVNDLPVIACMNPYGPSNDYRNDELDYMLGFDLGKSISNWDENLVYVGKENPFQTGKIKPIIWTKIEDNQFPIAKDLKNKIDLSTYFFATEKYDYYLQKPTENISSYHLVILDKITKSEILNTNYYDGESTYLTRLKIAESENERDIRQSQWTGEIIKNKATVVFGFVGHSFGCPSITILDETEPEIQILCDNRH